MRLKKPANLSTVDYLVINDQSINIVDDFKYLGSYVGSTEHDVPIREMMGERQLKFTGHCIRMPTDEPINRFVLNESKVRPSLRPGAQTRTYRQKISSHLLSGEKALEATETCKIAMNKSA